MSDSEWLSFDNAVAYLRMQTGLDDAADLLRGAIADQRVRSHGGISHSIRGDIALIAGGMPAGLAADYAGGITSADIAYDPNLQPLIFAADVRGLAGALKRGKDFRPKLTPQKPSRALTRSQREAALDLFKKLRASKATNDEEVAAVERLLGWVPRDKDMRDLRREAGLKEPGRKPTK